MKKIFSLSVLILLSITYLFSQKIDSTFQEPFPIRPAKINCIKTSPDGKMLIGGEIKFFQEKRVNNLIRLNADGSLDNSFNLDLTAEFFVKNIELQSNGDIIVLADKYIDGLYENKILLKLNPDGSIIKMIDSPTFFYLESISVQNDDKVLVCGGTWSAGYLNRFNSDLTPDSFFNSNVSINDMPTFVTCDANNIYLTGYFSEVNGETKNSIVKLKLDGSIDPTFDVGSGTEDAISYITVQNDGKLLLSNINLNTFNGVEVHSRLLRLNSDGSVDEPFSSLYFLGTSSRAFIKDSMYYMAGEDANNPAGYGNYLMRIKYDGSIDSTFEMKKLDEFGFYDLQVGIIGNDIIYNNSLRTGSKYGLSSCDSIGRFDSTFTPEVGRFGTINAADYFEGNLIIAGDFIRVNKIETFGLARLDKDGIVDSTFVLSEQNGAVKQIEILNANEIIISTQEKLFKINSKAEIQSDFNFAPFKDLYSVNKFSATTNKKVIAGSCNNVYRLNEDGSEDTTFNIGTGNDGMVNTMYDFDIQGDKVIFGSDFNKFQGVPVNRMVRLNNDGSVDPTFNIGSGPDGTVSLIKVLNNGEIIVGGDFKKFDGVSVPHRLVKLSKDGALDSTFIKNQISGGNFTDMFVENPKVVEWGNKIIIKTIFTIISLNSNGLLDKNFKVPFSISRLDDIITYTDSLPVNASKSISYTKKSQKTAKNNKRGLDNNALSASDTTISNKSYLYSVGIFEKTGTSNPSFLLKLNIENTSNNTTTIIDNSIKDPYYTGYIAYPNPVGNQLNVKVGAYSDILTLKIFDIKGRLVYESKYADLPEDSILKENVENLERGVYVLKVFNNNESVLTKNIIKK